MDAVRHHGLQTPRKIGLQQLGKRGLSERHKPSNVPCCLTRPVGRQIAAQASSVRRCGVHATGFDPNSQRDMLAQLNQLEIQDKVGSAESLPGIDQVGKTPTHIMVCGKPVNLEEGSDAAASCLATPHGYVKPENITTDLLDLVIPSLPNLMVKYFPNRLPGQHLPPLQSLSSRDQKLKSAIVSQLEPNLVFVLMMNLIRDGAIVTAKHLVEKVADLYPKNTMLNSWRQTLQCVKLNNSVIVPDLLSALQQFQPMEDASKPDIAQSHFCIGHQARGFAEMSEYLEQNPGDAKNWARQGWMKIQLDDLRGAFADFQCADHISPLDDFESLALFGLLGGVEPGFTISAIHILDRALHLRPATYPARRAYSQTLLARGRCKQMLQQFDFALEDFTTAIKLWPERFEAYMCTAETYLALNDAAAARRAIDDRLAKMEFPDSASLLIKQAKAQADVGSYAAAIATVNAAQASEPLPEKIARHCQQLEALLQVGLEIPTDV